MSTFLTNRRMSPALRARIEASVTGRKSPEGASARIRAILRFIAAVSIVIVIVLLLMRKRESGRTFEMQRSAVLDSFHAQTSGLTDRDRASVTHDESMLLELAAIYDGDLVTDDMRAPNAFAHPMAYVHGPVESFANGSSIEKVARASLVDSFAHCVVDAPKSRTERDVASRVRAVYTGVAKAPDVHRLGDAYVALHVLQPSWEARARAAREESELALLKTELDRAHIDQALGALRADRLLVAMDEPGDPKATAELDGERPHEVRIALFDLPASKVLLRMRKRVDPTSWSEMGRAEYAAGLDACALAFDVRLALR